MVPSHARLSGVLCARCGTILPPEDLTDQLLRKLSQLAEFGLVGEARPLLEPSGEDA